MNEEKSAFEKRIKKRKQPEPFCLEEKATATSITSIPDLISFLHNSFYFKLEKSTIIPPSTWVLNYQFFVQNPDTITYTSKSVITLTIKNLGTLPIIITIRSTRLERDIAPSLENHEWGVLIRPQTYADFFEIITEELNKEFYILRCISFIQAYKALNCWNPKGCRHNNSFHLKKQELILQPSLVILKCGHHFHQKCLPVKFRQDVGGCPICGTLIETDADDYFMYEKPLPKITIINL
jgi:hypothetical protein